MRSSRSVPLYTILEILPAMVHDPFCSAQVFFHVLPGNLACQQKTGWHIQHLVFAFQIRIIAYLKCSPAVDQVDCLLKFFIVPVTEKNRDPIARGLEYIVKPFTKTSPHKGKLTVPVKS